MERTLSYWEDYGRSALLFLDKMLSDCGYDSDETLRYMKRSFRKLFIKWCGDCKHNLQLYELDYKAAVLKFIYDWRIQC